MKLSLLIALVGLVLAGQSQTETQKTSDLVVLKFSCGRYEATGRMIRSGTSASQMPAFCIMPARHVCLSRRSRRWKKPETRSVCRGRFMEAFKERLRPSNRRWPANHC